MAIPTYVASSFTTTLTGTNPNASVNVALPTGWADGDIGIIVATSGNYHCPAGWFQLPPHPGGGATAIYVFWKRLVTGETDPVVVEKVADSDNERMVSCHAFRGCVASGNPLDAVNRGTITPASTTLTCGGVTTRVNDCLIVCIGANGSDNVTGSRASAEANANLSSVTERFDQWTALGGGQGQVVFTGGLATAGATGNSTATVPSDTSVWWTLALKPAGTEDTYQYVGPSWVSSGSVVFSNTVNVTPGAPSGQLIDDVMLLQVYRSSGAPSTPSGWNAIDTGIGEMYVFWRRATANAESMPTITWASGELGAVVYLFRGCITAGNPYELESQNQDTDATNPVLTSALTPTLDQSLMFACFSNGVDNVAAPRMYAFHWDADEDGYVGGNTSGDGVEYIRRIHDQWSAVGNGMGMAAMVGEKRKAGAAGQGKGNYLGGGETTESLVLNLIAGLAGVQTDQLSQAWWIG